MCNKLSKLWEELAKEVNGSEIQNVGIGKANCEAETELCEGITNNKNSDHTISQFEKYDTIKHQICFLFPSLR